jgi:hypothetical protein
MEFGSAFCKYGFTTMDWALAIAQTSNSGRVRETFMFR